MFSSLLLAVLVGAAFCAPKERAYSLDNGGLQNPPSLDDIVSSCSGVIEWPLSPTGWLSADTAHVYPSFPPTSGTFAPIPAPPGNYSTDDADLPTVPEAMSGLWRGDIVIWYSPLIPEDQKTVLFSVANTRPGGANFIVLPWTSKDGINEGSFSKKPVVLTAWGLSQACAEASVNVFDNFVATAAESPAPGLGFSSDEMGPKGVEP